MAAVTFNSVHQQQHSREQLKAVLAALHEMLDASMQRAGAEVGYAHLRGSGGTAAQPLDTQ